MEKSKKINYIISFLLLFLVYLMMTLLVHSSMFSRYQISVIILICINIILAVSLNITVGCLGQITIGHAGFMSVGAYTAALFSKSALVAGVPGFLIALILGGIVSGIIGVIIGIPALRLNGDYLAIITLAFGEIIRVFIEYFDFTGGAQGLRGIPKFNNFDLIYWIMVFSVILMFSLMTSRHGRAILAIREDEIASSASGINTTYYKTFAFTLSAIFAGIAGGIYAHNLGVLGAKQFDYNYSINILVMVVLGGMGSFTGSIIAAIVLTLLPEVLREFSDYRMIAYAVILIFMMIFRPKGLLGREEFRLSVALIWCKNKLKMGRK
ncbi:branched-chain amino acid ABC transporter permease [Fusobacterium necrophorum]|uniref:Branched-chain amino acid ABC transporter permease n=1 Tax=Fusobacterium necrophorum BL TaxID=1441732 RepID=A0AB73BUW5_9FUSO|nr:branched-chain amino acid ABC transporter permease [Fusobacterium necrophorum]AVQ20159.1 branched-chain amino acid ABC transporter permease [Fusobacterium necrophorum subsp. funduliforme]AYZ73837.1 branched-chain amino acid ABC transporter permease [Fusobacterium necrophorum]AZW08157.1 branched-chain amino acid ABC transporter permease [Fusobacterium necrophorum subsp. necrophorum]KDE62159.1 branched-chain amino acid ABC transporter permease [Fusobacterium necrophorum BL]KYM46147.1 ABC tran